MGSVERYRKKGFNSELAIKTISDELEKPLNQELNAWVADSGKIVRTNQYKKFVASAKKMLDGLDLDWDEMESVWLPVIYNAKTGISPNRKKPVISVSILSTSIFAVFGATPILFGGPIWSGFAVGGISLILFGGAAAFSVVSDRWEMRELLFEQLALNEKDWFVPEQLYPYLDVLEWCKKRNLMTSNKSYASLVESKRLIEKTGNGLEPSAIKSKKKKSILAPNVDEGRKFTDQFASLEKIHNRVIEWEMDILKVVQYPALFDFSVKQTKDFQIALRRADSIKPLPDTPFDASNPFVDAVVSAEIAWESAVNYAERVKTGGFPETEQKRLATALSLLKIAMDGSGSPEERQVSYKRAMKEMDGLVSIPESAILELENSGLRLGLDSK